MTHRASEPLASQSLTSRTYGWEDIPLDIFAKILLTLERKPLGSVRLTCRAWRSMSSRSIQCVTIRFSPSCCHTLCALATNEKPTRVTMLRPFNSLTRLRIQLPARGNLSQDVTIEVPGSVQELHVCSDHNTGPPFWMPPTAMHEKAPGARPNVSLAGVLGTSALNSIALSWVRLAHADFQTQHLYTPTFKLKNCVISDTAGRAADPPAAGTSDQSCDTDEAEAQHSFMLSTIPVNSLASLHSCSDANCFVGQASDAAGRSGPFTTTSPPSAAMSTNQATHSPGSLCVACGTRRRAPHPEVCITACKGLDQVTSAAARGLWTSERLLRMERLTLDYSAVRFMSAGLLASVEDAGDADELGEGEAAPSHQDDPGAIVERSRADHWVFALLENMVALRALTLELPKRVIASERESLVSLSSLQQLTRLKLTASDGGQAMDVDPQGITNAEMGIFARMPQLRELDLSKSSLRWQLHENVGLTPLSHLTNLESLTLQDCPFVGRDTAFHLVHLLPALTSLDLSRCLCVCVEIGHRLAAYSSKLQRLRLSGCEVSGPAGRYFLAAKGLRELDLSRCHGLTTRHVLALIESTPKLARLWHDECADVDATEVETALASKIAELQTSPQEVDARC